MRQITLLGRPFADSDRVESRDKICKELWVQELESKDTVGLEY